MKIVNLLDIVLFALTSVVCSSDPNDAKGQFDAFESHEYETDDGNITNIIESNNVGLNVTDKPGVLCEEARIRCALRQGCGAALQSYMLDCSDIMQGRTEHCDEFCKSSLIALTSTEEGESLMNCLCTDEFCKQSKKRLEVCREEVILANARNAVVSCSVAHLICSADTSCSTALYYYDKFCRRMFIGRGCSFRCNNSISILERQKKAEKLSTCLCDGSEPFACEEIKTNMATLCFNQKDEKNIQKQEEETNQIYTPQPNAKGNQNSTGSKAPVGGYGLSLMVAWLMMVNNIWSGWSVGVVEVMGLRCLVGLTSSMVVRWL